jgi:formylglycine-generating enzyme required for sulfatase activity
MKIRGIVFLLRVAARAYSADVVLSFTELVVINGGMFLMGSPEHEAQRSGSEGPRHHVLLNSFYLGKSEVTQSEYEDVMGKNPSRFKGPDLPVESVTWYEAVEFCNRLSEWERLTPAYTIEKNTRDPNNKNEKDTVKLRVTWNRGADGYRLPTEAEWEYACRAGRGTPFGAGNIITTFDANYNGEYPYNDNLKGIYRRKTTTAGSFAPNDWGLHDMHGNTAEWCWDWFGDYTSEAETNPAGAESGALRVMRGGSWNDHGQNLRSSHRSCEDPFFRGSDIGFRVARNG